MCRSRRELSNEYLLAKIGVDTAENELLEVWGENSIQYSIVSLAAAGAAERSGGRQMRALCGSVVGTEHSVSIRSNYGKFFQNFKFHIN